MAFQRLEGTILVVDDEPKLLYTLNSMFHRQGYQVLTATNGEAALAIIEDLYVDIHLVLLDLKMPGLSGTEVLKIIKSKYPKVPVGILTAYGEYEAECLSNGADFFQTKPYSLRKLQQDVERAVQKRKSPKEVVEIKPGYMPCATILVVDDEEEICDFVRERLTEDVETTLGEYKVYTAKNGDEGIKKAREVEPDFIIVDIKMCRMRGDEMIQILEAEGPRPKDYIILTAVDTRDELNKIRKFQLPYVPKPFDPDKFCADLRELCFKHGLIKPMP